MAQADRGSNWLARRTRAAAERAIEIGAKTYGSVKSILDNKLDRKPAPKRAAVPVIQPLHLIFSRCILETLNAVIVLALFMFAVSLFDVDILPSDTAEAAKAIAAAVFLGIGLGFFNVVMCALVGQYFLVFFILVMIGLYMISGAYLPPNLIPATLREYMAYNPLTQLVEWLRSAYYASYDPELINKLLIYWVGGISLMLGLVDERFLRGRFLS
ncbi:hypothetical protein [Methylocystis sp.]|uniref:hypothetical protein n=1 Tax=Methylocystis sp. TaxID=1911079 RepID=UPI00345B734C